MYELNKLYGWSKFIIVVPSIAIREGVAKSFETMQEHFANEYGKRIQFFVYNSKQLSKIDSFANDSGLHVMIINTQATRIRKDVVAMPLHALYSPNVMSLVVADLLIFWLKPIRL